MTTRGGLGFHGHARASRPSVPGLVDLPVLGSVAMKQRCPTCKTPLREESPALALPTFPFCGPRCKLADLGSWLDGKYAVVSASFDEGAGFDEDATQPEDFDAENYN